MVNGIPIVLQDVSRANAYGLAFGEPIEATLARALEPDATALRQSLDHFSTYLDASWGDFAAPKAEVEKRIERATARRKSKRAKKAA